MLANCFNLFLPIRFARTANLIRSKSLDRIRLALIFDLRIRFSSYK